MREEKTEKGGRGEKRGGDKKGIEEQNGNRGFCKWEGDQGLKEAGERGRVRYRKAKGTRYSVPVLTYHNKWNHCALQTLTDKKPKIK